MTIKRDDLEIEEICANIEQMRANVEHMQQSGKNMDANIAYMKIQSERIEQLMKWQPVFIVTALAIAAGTVIRLFM